MAGQILKAKQKRVLINHSSCHYGNRRLALIERKRFQDFERSVNVHIFNDYQNINFTFFPKIYEISAGKGMGHTISFLYILRVRRKENFAKQKRNCEQLLHVYIFQS